MNILNCAALLLAASGAAAAVELPGPVVAAAWVNEHRADLVVLDVRSDLAGFVTAPEYTTDAKTGAKVLVSGGGHIAEARLVDFNLNRVSRMVGDKKIDKMLPSGAEVQALMLKLGVGEDDALVITSPGETVDEVDMAARFYWTLKSYGETDMAVLDGGNAAWLAANLPVSTTAAADIAAGDWTATRRASTSSRSTRPPGAPCTWRITAVSCSSPIRRIAMEPPPSIIGWCPMASHRQRLP